MKKREEIMNCLDLILTLLNKIFNRENPLLCLMWWCLDQGKDQGFENLSIKTNVDVENTKVTSIRRRGNLAAHILVRVAKDIQDQDIGWKMCLTLSYIFYALNLSQIKE